MTEFESEHRMMLAADTRRRLAETVRQERGDRAYLQQRASVAGVGAARRAPGNQNTLLRAVTEVRNGKELVHTSGYFTRYNRPYPMWDAIGPYKEKVRAGAGARTLAGRPEVAFLTNHGGMAMARTTSGTLELEERAGSDPGGWHDGWLNPKRSDVNDLIIAIEDANVPQMSFAFMIPEGCGVWSADFTEFEIVEYDIDGGDVSAVNFGANPYTDITARTAEILDDLSRLPRGALMEARSRLDRLSGMDGAREQITVQWGRGSREIDAKASPVRRRLQGRILRTAARFVDLAKRTGMGVEDLPTVRLPWYEIRAGQPVPAEEPGGEPVESTDVFVFDEIGGSFGVDAKSFAEDLNAITTPRIHLRINSPGGSVTEAMAIRSSLLHHPAWITASVDGIAASAASVIALGADEIETMPGAQWMLHDASITIDGNEAELQKATTWIGRQSDNAAELYAQRMGITTAEARQMMLDETWAFAEEAVELGLADRVGGPNSAKQMPQDMAERMNRKHDLSRFAYRYAGRAEAPAPRVAAPGETRGGVGKAATPGPVQNRSTPDQPKGRSIALIEAQLELDERS